ncbi:heme-binding protein [Lichenihabitans sp. PAMC28606]|uniref:GlcG/HbpS family heme-binding protein n=1 Tax=Lichenihabitans sp. PAMC28606 TaxID=2880932 RepID=UPI001D0AA309|nr:heme-binding protein [Lichenihabitans sp. PAMC28606]UDL93274.1 heme-binding protein [Lichenihabitans sp. PAMC28606]
MTLTLTTAQTLVTAILDAARKSGLKPMAIAVLDARGAIKAAAAEDGTSLKRFEIAHGKAYGALALGMGSRSLGKRAVDQAFFIAAVTHAVGGDLVPVPGGVLLYDQNRLLLGAVGASGDTSDQDEKAIMSAIAATGLVGEPGQD